MTPCPPQARRDRARGELGRHTVGQRIEFRVRQRTCVGDERGLVAKAGGGAREDLSQHRTLPSKGRRRRSSPAPATARYCGLHRQGAATHGSQHPSISPPWPSHLIGSSIVERVQLAQPSRDAVPTRTRSGPPIPKSLSFTELTGVVVVDGAVF